jgi:hypothetical protein
MCEGMPCVFAGATDMLCVATVEKQAQHAGRLLPCPDAQRGILKHASGATS